MALGRLWRAEDQPHCLQAMPLTPRLGVRPEIAEMTIELCLLVQCDSTMTMTYAQIYHAQVGGVGVRMPLGVGIGN